MRVKLSSVFCLERVLFLDTEPLPSRDVTLSLWLRGDDVTLSGSRDRGELFSVAVLRGIPVSFSSLLDLIGESLWLQLIGILLTFTASVEKGKI
jgi:hypothetical protein